MLEMNSINEELHTNKILMSDHAYQRAKERFNMPNKDQALGHFRGMLRQAHRIGLVTSEDGKDSVLYALDRIAIHLSLDLTEIRTMYRHENITYEKVKNKIIQIHRKEFNKLDRIEKCRIKQLEDMKLKYAIEEAELNYRYKKKRDLKVFVTIA